MNSLTSQTLSRPPSASSQALDLAIRRLSSALEREGINRFSISSRCAPTDDERRALRQRHAEIAASLRPASAETIVRLVSVMRTGFPSQSGSDIERKGALQVYASALGRFPEWVIERACRDAIEGRIGKGQFAPSAAEMATHCEGIVRQAREELGAIERILSARVYHEPTDEERRKVVDGFERLSRDLAAALEMEEAGKPRLEPMTLEQVTERAGTLAAGLRLSEETRRRLGLMEQEGA